MEAVGAPASIIAIAGAGIQISLKLIAFADQVGTAPKRIQDVGTDVSVTAGTLQELGELLEKAPKKRSAGIFRPDQIQNIKASSTRCKSIFDELEDILRKASKQLREVYKSQDLSTAKSRDTIPKIRLSKIERMRWPFLQPSMEPLLSSLRDAKGTLTLILQVVHLRHAHTTPSLDQEEQNDLIRMIAAMRRQQLASFHVDKGGSKEIGTGGTNDSDSGEPSEVETVLEAWSVIPNTNSDDSFRHFLLTPIPVSRQQIVGLLRTSPQDLHQVASMIDSLLPAEREAILEGVLDIRAFGPDRSSIRSITAQSWTGSHELFGKVDGRKFKLIIERKVGIPNSSRRQVRQRTAKEAQHIPKVHSYYSDSNSTMYDSASDVDAVEDPSYTRRSSHSPPSREHRRRRAPPVYPGSGPWRRSNHTHAAPEFKRRRPASDDDWKRRQEIEEKKFLEEMLQKDEKEKKWSPNSQPRTEWQPASESSDDDLVKSLLTQYTNFDPGEPLVQGFSTPQTTYDEAFVIPKRVPRPY